MWEMYAYIFWETGGEMGQGSIMTSAVPLGTTWPKRKRGGVAVLPWGCALLSPGLIPNPGAVCAFGSQSILASAGFSPDSPVFLLCLKLGSLNKSISGIIWSYMLVPIGNWYGTVPWMLRVTMSHIYLFLFKRVYGFFVKYHYKYTLLCVSIKAHLLVCTSKEVNLVLQKLTLRLPTNTGEDFTQKFPSQRRKIVMTLASKHQVTGIL